MPAAASLWTPNCVKHGPISRSQKTVIAAGRLVFTTSGAVDSTNSVLPAGCTAEKPSGTGLYTLTFPACKNLFVLGLNYNDASGGADTVTGKSVLACTGRVTFTTKSSGSAATATSGDSVDFAVILEA